MSTQQQESSQQNKIMGGNLETLGLQATLKTLSLSGKTGQLSVVATNTTADGRPTHERLDIYLKKGSIIALHASDPGQIDLLEILRLMHRIHRRDAQEIRERVGTQLPYVLAALVERNIISPAEQQQRMEFAIIQEVARAQRWERGTFEFHTNVNVTETSMAPLNVDHVLLEAIRMVDEWQRVAVNGVSRYSTPRWLPDFNGDVKDLNLAREDISVLFLSNGQIPIYAIAYGLLTSEALVAHSVETLMTKRLVEVVNDQLERKLEQSLANALTVSRSQFKNDPRLSTEQRLQMLIHTMGTCINKLLSHHSIFARAQRGRGQEQGQDAQTVQQLEREFLPLLRRAQREYPIIEAVTFHAGQVDYQDLMELYKLVRGDQLETFYWEAAQAFHKLMNDTFAMIIDDEIGPSRASRRFSELWSTFAQEIDGEMERQSVRRIANQPRRQQPNR
jgi:hypothetical protein